MISVILTFSNNETYIEETIKSIIKQSYKCFELIVINVGSTDSSESIIQSFNDPRIVFINQHHINISQARNYGLTISKGDYILFHDPTDISLPYRFEIVKNQFYADDIGFVHSDMIFIDKINQMTGYVTSKGMENDKVARFFLSHSSPYILPTFLMRRKAIENFAFDESISNHEQFEMVLELSKRWESLHIAEPLLFKRRHPENKINYTEQEKITVLKLIRSTPLQELVTEIDWSSKSATPKAYAILALILKRRDLLDECKSMFALATSHANTQMTNVFVTAIGFMIADEFETAIQLFQNVLNSENFEDRAIVLNYLGECLVYKNEMTHAFQYFMQALTLDPNYTVPLENLKVISSTKQYEFIDVGMTKYAFKRG